MNLNKEDHQPPKSIWVLLFLVVCAILLVYFLRIKDLVSDSKKKTDKLETEVQKLRDEMETMQEELEEDRTETVVPQDFTAVPENTSPLTVTPEPAKESEYLGDLEAVEAETLVDFEEVNWDNLGIYFADYEISDQIFERIYGDNCSYKTYCTIPRENLRYIKVLHYDFNAQIRVGELMVNRELASDIKEIFLELFKNQYQIDKMYLVDNYHADDDLSCMANNTSAFNYRMITGGSTLSNHAFGCAIDINPVNNPYVTFSNGSACVADEAAWQYIDRTQENAEELHMITHEDLCYKLFTAHGWTWGGDWSFPIDYQHFEKDV